MPSSSSVVACAVTIVSLVMGGMSRADADAPAEPPIAGPSNELRVAPQAGRGTELAVLSPPEGITVAAGSGPSVDTPWIISPVVRGDSGVQALITVVDQPEFLLR